MNKTELQKRSLLIPSAIAALMLFGALGRWPYGYYQLLRFVVCGVSVYIAFMAYHCQRQWATWLFGLIAVLFNPLAPIHLSREVWQAIDVVCVVLFISITAILRKPNERQVRATQPYIHVADPVALYEGSETTRKMSLHSREDNINLIFEIIGLVGWIIVIAAIVLGVFS